MGGNEVAGPAYVLCVSGGGSLCDGEKGVRAVGETTLVISVSRALYRDHLINVYAAVHRCSVSMPSALAKHAQEGPRYTPRVLGDQSTTTCTSNLRCSSAHGANVQALLYVGTAHRHPVQPTPFRSRRQDGRGRQWKVQHARKGVNCSWKEAGLDGGGGH